MNRRFRSSDWKDVPDTACGLNWPALVLVLAINICIPQCARPLTVSAFHIQRPVNVSPVACIGGGGQPMPVSSKREIDEEVENSYAVSSNANTGTGMPPTTTATEFTSQPGMLDFQIVRMAGNCSWCSIQVERIFSGSWIFFLLTGAAASNWGGVEGNILYYRVPAGVPQGAIR